MYSFDTGSDNILGIVREYKGQKLLGLFSFSDQWLRTVIENNDWEDLTYKDSYYIKGQDPDTEYWIEPYGFRWLLKGAIQDEENDDDKTTAGEN